MTAKQTPTDKLAGALATTEKKQPVPLHTLINQSAKELGRALPAHLNPERLTRIALTCIRLNPDLATCTQESFLGSLFVLAQLGLEPIAGRAYLLPFKNNRKVGDKWTSIREVQAIIGYKGYADLFYRHESGLALDFQTVFENDEFDYQFGTQAFLRHKPAKSNRGKATHYYAIAQLKGGVSKFHVMSVEEVIEHAKEHSKTFDKKNNKFYPGSPWADDFDSMAKKTVLIQLAKTLPLSVEMQQAIAVDNTSRDYRAGIDSALDMPVTTTWREVETKDEVKDPETPPAPPAGEAKTAQPEQPPEPGSFGAFEG